MALALGAFTTLVSAAVTGRGAAVTVALEKNAFAADEGILARVTITNTTRGELRILRWFTPSDGVKENLFRVTVYGKEVEYLGPDYKRPEPTAKDYITLRPGESLDATVDLSGYYDFTDSGYYAVEYNADALNLFTNQPNMFAKPEALKSEAVEAWVEGREVRVGDGATADSVVGSTSFTGCSTSRQSSLNTARNNAYTYASNALGYLNAGTTGSRYTTWFGTYSSSRYSTVRSHFSSISNAMNNAAVNFNCTCTDSAYAYVYPTQPYKIYLCNAFWSAPSTGTDSKAGTLVHEMSHFNVVASTDDWAYGQTAAKSLARSNPSRAIDNADSHEYFAENTPALP
ncbi:MAG: peptidase M35 [Acidobacteria bacterium]|nr:peptidase M35 [Acidobacteriota bacterium]